MARIVRERHEDCGCRRCGTSAKITDYACGCVTVRVYNDRDPCAECTNFSGKKRYCSKPGHPDGH